MQNRLSLREASKPTPDLIHRSIVIVAIAWVVMQWWWASPLSFALGGYIPLFHLDEQKFTHLSFAIIFSAIAVVRVARAHYSPAGALMAMAAILVVASPCLYLVLESDALSLRAGNPTQADIVMGIVGLTVLLLFTYMELSRGLVVLALLCIAYLLWGDGAIVPESLQWKGASLSKTISHLWLYTEGVFGISIGVATQFIFLFVLFGEILQKIGFGHFITRLSVLLLAGHKAGSAKAAILSSTAIGSISGSSTANVVTTGSFTIPLMMKSGVDKDEAGAIEVAASSNGQLMPPIMGAAAFLMAEYTNTPYHELIYYALLPALCAFFGLLCIVHLRACAIEGNQEMPIHQPRIADRLRTIHQQSVLWRLAFKIAGVVLAFVMLYLVRQNVPADVFFFLGGLGLVALYMYWIYQNGHIEQSPETETAASVWRSGKHFCLPIIVLLWLLIVEGYSPYQSVWWAVLSALAMLWTHDALMAWSRSGNFEDLVNHYRNHRFWEQFCQICVTTAKRMLPISLATATAGVIVGTITLSGLQQVLGDIVLLASGGSFVLLLVMLAAASLLLGLGLPTTPNYILISSLFAGVLYTASEQFGYSVPLVAIHLFILYFGVLADDTPPVGLCAFAASAISGGNPIKTGIKAFILDTRTAILPFAFIFNPSLLMIDAGVVEGIIIFATALGGMYLFSAALQSWFLIRNNFFESLLLMCASLILLCPQWLHMQFFPRWEARPVSTLNVVSEHIDNEPLRLEFVGPDNRSTKVMTFESEEKTAYTQTIRQSLGVQINPDGTLEEVDLFSIADDMEITPDWKLSKISAEVVSRPDPRWFWSIALLLTAIVIGTQRIRRKSLAPGMQIQ